MKSRIIRMGNSYGMRIPKLLLEQTGLLGQVEIIARGATLIIQPVRRPREGWASAFQEMARRGDDALLDDCDVMLDPWVELPQPAPLFSVTGELGPVALPDVPEIPDDIDGEGA